MVEFSMKIVNFQLINTRTHHMGPKAGNLAYIYHKTHDNIVHIIGNLTFYYNSRTFSPVPNTITSYSSSIAS